MDYGKRSVESNGIFEWRDTVVRLVTVFLRFLQRNSISTQREAPNVSEYILVDRWSFIIRWTKFLTTDEKGNIVGNSN
jgi:hypothetical protein